MVVQLCLGKYTLVHCTPKVLRLPNLLFCVLLTLTNGIPALILKTPRPELLQKEISQHGRFSSLPAAVEKQPSGLAGYLDFRPSRHVPGKEHSTSKKSVILSSLI